MLIIIIKLEEAQTFILLSLIERKITVMTNIESDSFFHL